MRKGLTSRKLLQGPSSNNNLDINQNYGNLNDDDTDKKKLMHRDIERQRRKEMAALYAGLRSLIPLEYIKGRRSISDHMNGAVNYIKLLQTRITELGDRRDELIKKSNNLRAVRSIIGNSNNFTNSTTTSRSCISVKPCSIGVEIFLSSTTSSSSTATVPLSRVLQLALGQGLTLVSCATTKVNERLLHTIQAEVTDPTICNNINFSQLQQNLNEKMSSWNKSS